GQFNASSSIGGSFSYNQAAGTILAAGPQTLTATFTPSDLVNYTAQTVSATLTVNKATLTLTANSASRPYNTANPVFTGSLAGAVNGDSFTESFATPATITSTAGTYPITPSAVGTALGNYTVAASNGVLTITAASTAATVTWNPAALTYGTGLGSGQFNATSSIGGSFSYNQAAGTILAAGPQTLTATFTPSDLVNYTAQTVSATLTVNKATLTVTAGNANRTYGTPNPTFTASATGAAGTDSFTFTESTTATTTSPVGTYAIVPVATGTNLGNYTVVYVNGTLTIGQATLTVTAGNANRTYGTPNPTFTASATGAAGTDSFTFTESTTATTTSPVGTYAIVPVATGTNLGNYTVVYNNGTLTIGQATLTVTAGNANRTYGSPNPTFTASELGAVNGDSFTFTESTTATTTSPVGTYAIVPVATGTNLSDYNVVYNNGTLTIGQATLTVTAGNANRTYGSPNPTFTASATGAAGTDSFTFTESTTATTTSPVGTYAIVPVAT